MEETLGQNFIVPKYDIVYKQTVEAAEVYGGFRQVTPGTGDSQYLVVRIQLPNETVQNVSLEVTEQSLTLFAKRHRLHLELPHAVDEKQTRASWRNGTLEVTVRRSDVE